MSIEVLSNRELKLSGEVGEFELGEQIAEGSGRSGILIWIKNQNKNEKKVQKSSKKKVQKKLGKKSSEKKFKNKVKSWLA